MRGFSGNHKWRFSARVAFVVLLAGNAAVVAATPAYASTCTRTGSTVTATLDSGATPTFSVSAGNILMGATQCGDATTSNTTAITITGNTGAESVTITDPNAFKGTQQITFAIDLSTQGSGNDTLTLNAAAAGVTWRAGAAGIDFNGDGTVDLTYAGVEAFFFEGGAGNDTIDCSGGTTAQPATGAPFAIAVTIDGGAGNDTLTGGAGGDTINGNTGNDVIDGGAGNDTINGNEDTDTVSYASSPSAVTVNLATPTGTGSGNGADTITNVENIIGSPQGDTLTGSSGDNVITGGAGNDTIVGGNGTDTADYSDSAVGVTVSLAITAPTAQDTGDGSDTLSQIEALSGSSHNDTLTGTTGADTLNGGGGDDTLHGMGGADILDGSSGNDTADFSDQTSALTIDLTKTDAQAGANGATILNVENLIGGSGGDSFTGDGNANILNGGGGDDTLDGGGGADSLIGGDGSDTASYASATSGVTVDLSKTAAQNTGGAGSDTLATIENLTGSGFDDTLKGDANANVIDGGAGNDTIVAGAGNDTITGGVGNDVLDGGAGDDSITGGGGNDTVTYATAAAAVTVDLSKAAAQATGGSGSDTIAAIENLVGSRFNDSLKGDANANVITGGPGNDAINGGAGSDTADYSSATTGVTVNLGITGAQNTVGAGTDTLTSIENLTGGSGNDLLAGNSAANVISGGAGNDVLLGEGGNDTLNGGTGEDATDYRDAPSAVTVDLSLATPQNTGGAGTDTLSGIEDLIGSAFNDTLTGDANANVITGGPGNDTMTGGGGEDMVDYSDATQGVSVSLLKTTAQNTIGDGTDTITGFQDLRGSAFNDSLIGDAGPNFIDGGRGNDRISGLGGNDSLFGGAGNDLIYGGAGNDLLAGEAGNDFLSGDAGNDSMFGGAGIDVVSFASSPARVAVDLARGATGQGTDRISGIENLVGSRFNDRLVGTNGANVIHGGPGNDVIYGLGGSDILYGGTGTDALNGGLGFDRCIDSVGTRTAGCERLG